MAKIGNNKKAILPNSKAFNDEDILMDIMLTLKHLAGIYGILGQEASHKAFAKKVDDINKDTGTCLRNAFNLMFENGWYTLEEETAQKLETSYNKFLKKEEDFTN
jgi:spore coat protein CotF